MYQFKWIIEISTNLNNFVLNFVEISNFCAKFCWNFNYFVLRSAKIRKISSEILLKFEKYFKFKNLNPNSTEIKKIQIFCLAKSCRGAKPNFVSFQTSIEATAAVCIVLSIAHDEQ